MDARGVGCGALARRAALALLEGQAFSFATISGLFPRLCGDGLRGLWLRGVSPHGRRQAMFLRADVWNRPNIGAVHLNGKIFTDVDAFASEPSGKLHGRS